MSYLKRSILIDDSGNTIHVVSDGEGEKHVGTAFIQDILTSSNNFTTDNIGTGQTYTGDADETFGINGIQIFHAADANCRVYIDQGITDTFETGTTVTDYFDCLANHPCTRTYTSVSPYFRIRVSNMDFFATTSHITAAGMTPVINPLPRALSDTDRLKTETTITDNEDQPAGVTKQNELLVAPVYRLVGTTFGNTYDTNFWTTTEADGGTVTFNGNATLQTSTDAAGTSIIDSVRSARFVPGSANLLRGLARLNTVPVTGNTRRFGAYDDDNGFFFQVSGTTFGVGVRKATVDTIIESGSFNGDYGPIVVMDTGAYNLQIEYGTYGATWYVDGKILHKRTVKSTLDSLTETLEFPIRFENYNEGNTTDNGIVAFNCSIFRKGELMTNPTCKYIGTNTTTVCKYSAGKLHRITNLDNAGTVTVYDNTAASGKQIAVIDTAKALGTLEFGCPFSNGLTVVSASGAKVTVVYE